MELTPKQRQGLKLICDTFAPGDGNGLPSASALGADDVVAQLAAGNPRASERKQLASLLGLWNSPVIPLLAGVGRRRFSELSQEERERVLLAFADSRLPQRRAIFQALRQVATLAYYTTPGPTGSSPVWDDIGYPGPLGTKADAPPRALDPIRVLQDTTMDCDVVVVGSGAGGGTTAGVLAAAGLDVVVLEAGEYYDDQDFDGGELSGISRMYAAAPSVTSEGQVNLVAGSCLGGGTVVNYTTSFRTPDEVRDEWASHGVPAFAGAEYARSMDAVCERLGVNREHHVASSTDVIMERGLMELGWHVDAMPRNVKGCDMGIDCGRCGFGCRLGAKQSVTKTWLADAAQAGGRLVVGVHAQRITTTRGIATGVEAVTEAGHRLTVNARAVVAACGAIQTPALLRRSRLRNENIGRHLRLHPVTVIQGLMDEEVRPWEGGMQTRYSRQDADMDGNGYGVIYETGPLNPSLILAFTPWRSARQHRELMQALPHTTAVALILRDRDAGEVRVGRDGHPVVRYRLSDYDTAHVRRGVEGAARVLEAAGARRVWSANARLVSYEPRAKGSVELFVSECDAAGYGPGQCVFGSFHIMGTARMGGSPSTSATRPDGTTWDFPNVVVADASCFPTASGVNPMISIESIAHMNAQALAARLS